MEETALPAPLGESPVISGKIWASRLIKEAVDIFYPPQCAICDAFLKRKSDLIFAIPLCCSCCPWTSAAEFVAAGCTSCGSPLMHGTLCRPCRLNPLPLEKIFSLFWYRGRAEAVLKAFKYRGRWTLAKVLGEMLFTSLQADERYLAEKYDLLIPLPIAKRAFRERGFHQTALIAAAFSRLSHVPLSSRALFTRGSPASQASLTSLQSRFANVRGVFFANSRIVCGKRVLLLDDVLTTGATLSSAAAALHAAGALSVQAVTIGRSTAFFDYRVLEQ